METRPGLMAISVRQLRPKVSGLCVFAVRNHDQSPAHSGVFLMTEYQPVSQPSSAFDADFEVILDEGKEVQDLKPFGIGVDVIFD